jgi:Ribonuclease G/E
MTVAAAKSRPVTIHAAWSPGEVRVAAMADGVLVDYALWRPGAPDGVGDVYLGRVTAVVPAMAGAFVTLADGAQNIAPMDGFLPNSDGAKGLNEGTIVTVKVTRAALGGKGPRLSARVEPVEEGPAGLRRHGFDPLRELAARYPNAGIVLDDPALATSLRADLGERLTLVPQAFDDQIETEVDGLVAADVTTASGMRLSVHPTPALVAIDVDGGGALAGRDQRGDNVAARRHLALNAAVLPEIARQIRLRNLSGAILVDLAGMKAKQRSLLAPAMAEALADDPLRPRFLGFTALGLAEIVRPRVRAPLHEAMSGPLASGLAALRSIARSIRAEPGRRPMLRAASAVVAALQNDPVALPDLARITGQRLNLRSDPSLPGDSWIIEAPHG